ncbi:methylated-DNA--[protein]-cysteine S-methyltransferase [Alcaligenaceae bacterium]|nr:methylated-DNA--[protein]-cysteine S-methyltransferase [Alcaligenaceae bacterium]
MTFYAQMGTSLGRLLLCATDRHLTGLYFVGQKDCPVLEGLPTPLPEAADPTAGVLAGRVLKKVKLSQQLSILPNPRLQELSDSCQHNNSDLVFMQDYTPLGALAILLQTHEELLEYFQGQRTDFTVPINTTGSEFQNKVWELLQHIPYGELSFYGQLAEEAGMGSGHGRAVGTAVGRNPISIIIPCHRVLAANGTLNGYTGGLFRKQILLELEGVLLE